MKIKATLLPGQKGTRQLQKKYGDQLVCVRYRYDKARQKRLKTVELIIDEQDWVPGVTFPTTERVLLGSATAKANCARWSRRPAASGNRSRKPGC